jgi:hypothetical protein
MASGSTLVAHTGDRCERVRVVDLVLGAAVQRPTSKIAPKPASFLYEAGFFAMSAGGDSGDHPGTARGSFR